MTSTVFFSSLIVAWIVLYIAVPLWLKTRGRLLSGGIVQLFGAVLPGIWQAIFWPDEAGNFGLLMLLLVPLPMCVILAGSIANVTVAIRWLVHRGSGSTNIDADG